MQAPLLICMQNDMYVMVEFIEYHFVVLKNVCGFHDDMW